MSYTKTMIKDVNIRVSQDSHKVLRKIAKKEGRTIRRMFDIAVTSLSVEIQKDRDAIKTV